MPNPAITVESIQTMLADTAPSFPEQLDIEVLSIDEKRSIGAITVAVPHLHPGKFVHGGVWTGLGDSVAAWQTFRQLNPGENFTTVELKLNVFAGARLGDRITAIAGHLHTGRSTHVIEVRMARGEGDNTKLAANLIVTQFVIPAPEPGQGPADG